MITALSIPTNTDKTKRIIVLGASTCQGQDRENIPEKVVNHIWTTEG